MSLFSVILYGAINVLMVLSFLRRKGSFYQFPFWAGMIALGWFFPQAVGGYFHRTDYPLYAYEDALFFACLCTISLWVGFQWAVRKKRRHQSWLDASFDDTRLYYSGALLCLVGFFFQWKLWSLPEELLRATLPTGAVVKYMFLGNIFKLGFITLWLMGLSQARLMTPRFLVFIVPGLLLFIEAIIFRGRRAVMMELLACIVFGLWFVRSMSVPRWMIVTGLCAGLLLVNGIGAYRTIMMGKNNTSVSERLVQASEQDYVKLYLNRMYESGEEFQNYVFVRQYYSDTGNYDYGGDHWNRLVFNFVPAQIVGKEVKESLMLDSPDEDKKAVIKQKYGHSFMTGMTMTGYTDCFGSFGWFGWLKFFLVGYLMGSLYRHAIAGSFLGSFLYIFVMPNAIQSVSHGTNDILIRIWIYFFTLGYPFFWWAKRAHGNSSDMAHGYIESHKKRAGKI